MASQAPQIHFVLFPLMAQGHMIPMVDIARLLAQRGLKITIVTTPQNAARFEAAVTRARESGLHIDLVQLKFPSQEAGLPEGCESLDMLPSPDYALNFFNATSMLQQPAKELFDELTPRPNCVISDIWLHWTSHIARKFNIPRISFHGVSCFVPLCLHNVHASKVLENISSENEYFVVPDLPYRIEVTKSQLPGPLTSNLTRFREEIMEAEIESYGSIMNTFEELEPEFVKAYKKARKGKVWCIGPASLCNKDHLDKAQRGNTPVIDDQERLKWLDSWGPSSVVYVCLGSLCNLTTPQLIELGLGLEASNKPLIWVIRGGSRLEGLEKWIMEDGFEERTEGRGLLIRGWSPQVLILSHPAIGGFLTHCGWNSTLEGVCAGVPMVAWPLFADQFLNEKLVVQVLNIAISLGLEDPLSWGEEEKIGIKVKRETVKSAIERLMDEGEDSRERRERARKLGEMAKRALEEGGSSYLNMTLFIDEIVQLGSDHHHQNEI